MKNILTIANEELAAARKLLRKLIAEARSPQEAQDRRAQLKNLAVARFQINGRMTKAAGIAVVGGPNFGMIKLSKQIFSDPRNAENRDAHLRNTVRHELAHIAVPSDRSHGSAWRTMSKELGCTGEQYHEMAVTGKRRYDFQLSCPCCGTPCGTLHNRTTVSRWISNRTTRCCRVRPVAKKV